MVNYNIDLLKEIIKRDNCKIDLDKIDKLNKKARIDFICNCGNSNNKSFHCLYKFGGGFCKKCIEINKRKKMEATCMIKYNVNVSLKAKVVRDKARETCLEKYGSDNGASSNKVREKCKKTCLEKYGKEYSIQAEEVRNKGKQTFMDKYNTEFIFQSPEIKEKIKETIIKKYNVEHASQNKEVKDKIKKTVFERYGVECILQNDDIKKKIKKVCFERYGYEHPIQNAEIAEKQHRNSYKLKDFQYPCGKIIKLQGYEPFLLKMLVDIGYTSADIITNRKTVPEIWYIYNGKKHRYYSDAYIPKINTIYEVKAPYIYDKDIKTTLPLKKQACIDAGYNFKIYIFDDKGNIIKTE